MKREEWREQILQLPVFDSHTHINMPNVPIPAQNLWDIVHYFWFQQELWSVGYPKQADALPIDERTDSLVKAFNASRNTVWNKIIRHILNDLYKIDIKGIEYIDTEIVRQADQAIQWFSWQPDWSKYVIKKLNIRRIAVNHTEHADFKDLPGVSIVIPIWDGANAWVERIIQSTDRHATSKAAMDAARDYVEECHKNGLRGLRVNAEVFDALGEKAVNIKLDLPDADSEEWEIESFIAHCLFKSLSEFNMFAQMFMGIKRDVTPHTAMAVNDPKRIIDLYPLFEKYACDFELVIGAPGNNLDAVQAARIYPNVFLGGLWWYNFRTSTYMQIMQERFEAVPASKSILVASDARCIEWCYGKILLVKWLLADFLYQQIGMGWLNENDALWVAKEWLYDSAQRRYC